MTLQGLKAELESQHSGSDWFKGIEIDSDDGGPHLEFRVTSVQDMIHAGVKINDHGYRILFFSTGKGKEVASA